MRLLDYANLPDLKLRAFIVCAVYRLSRDAVKNFDANLCKCWDGSCGRVYSWWLVPSNFVGSKNEGVRGGVDEKWREGKRRWKQGIRGWKQNDGKERRKLRDTYRGEWRESEQREKEEEEIIEKEKNGREARGTEEEDESEKREVWYERGIGKRDRQRGRREEEGAGKGTSRYSRLHFKSLGLSWECLGIVCCCREEARKTKKRGGQGRKIQMIQDDGRKITKSKRCLEAPDELDRQYTFQHNGDILHPGRTSKN